MNLIRNVAEPSELILAWQPGVAHKDRHRWAVATLKVEDGIYVLRYLRPGLGFEDMNSGKTYDGLKKAGFDGYPAFDLKRDAHSKDVLATFLRRIPPRSRSDFRDYLHQFRISDQARVTDLSLLGLTEARLPSDGFSLVDPLIRTIDTCELVLEVAGYRHNLPSDGPAVVGEPANLKHESDNPVDASAVSVIVEGARIGYINRLQAPTFVYWLLHRSICAVVDRVEHGHERPRAFIFVKVRPAATMLGTLSATPAKRC